MSGREESDAEIGDVFVENGGVNDEEADGGFGGNSHEETNERGKDGEAAEDGGQEAEDPAERKHHGTGGDDTVKDVAPGEGPPDAERAAEIGRKNFGAGAAVMGEEADAEAAEILAEDESEHEEAENVGVEVSVVADGGTEQIPGNIRVFVNAPEKDRREHVGEDGEKESRPPVSPPDTEAVAEIGLDVAVLERRGGAGRLEHGRRARHGAGDFEEG